MPGRNEARSPHPHDGPVEESAKGILRTTGHYTGPDDYYFFGVEQGNSTALLLKAPAADGARGGAAVAPNAAVGVAIKNGAAVGGDLPKPQEEQEWVFRVTVEGDDITAWFFLRSEINKLDDPAPGPPVFDTSDNSNPKGCVGIRNDTIVGTVDDFAVYDAGGLAVDAKGKLTTTWGRIKVNY